VRRQVLSHQPAALGGHELAHQARTVPRQAVPNDQQPAGQMARQVAQEIQHACSADGAAIEAKEKVRQVMRAVAESSFQLK
jgi:hypothetical protein